jgi:subtilisin family serine protease
VRRLAAVAGLIALTAAATASAHTLFATNDPLAPRQWYLQRDHAFDFWPTALPQLAPVKVAVIDSGIDGGHPEFPLSRIAAAKSFVGGSPYVDTDGHGTFVAGEIAAAPDNALGIAGIAFPAQLVIAKVVNASGELPLDEEVAAIKWAVDQGARVINLSLGGVRDPLDPKLDTYSPLEQNAINYAIRKGVVVVAAVGNGPQSPRTPWPYAHYPAALPHVLGVSAVTETGAVPAFSNRDSLYNDIAAPGQNILSTVPRSMTAERTTCVEQGYSPCGTPEFRDSIGTSFAAPQVAAAAALVLSVRPDLSGDQVVTLLERTADDANPATGCKQCLIGRDAYSGWGTLDILKALQAATSGDPAAISPRDAYETNDEAGRWAAKLYGSGRTIHATVDFWDDQLDVYAVRLRKGERLFAHLDSPPNVDIELALWSPGTQSVEGIHLDVSKLAMRARSVGSQQRVAYTATQTGDYYLSVKLQTQTGAAYTLAYVKK